MTPVSPPNRKVTRKPIAQSMGPSNVSLPRHMVPIQLKNFTPVGTMWRGKLTFEGPMLWAIGLLVTFLFGGLTGGILASPPPDLHVTDTSFVVAHFHYVVFGTVVFAMFAGFYFWWPKFTGKMLDDRLGKVHFWMLFFG